MKSIVLMMMAVGLFAFQTAEAHPHKKNVHKQQYNQHQRIKQGVHSGSLTAKEAHMLRGQQARVRNYKQMAIADGRITYAERRLLDNTQRQAGRNIYYQKHDRQVRCR